MLSREAAAYQSAVDRYQRQARGFEKSLLTDSNGNVLVNLNGQFYAAPRNGGNASPTSSFTTKDGTQVVNNGALIGNYGMTPSTGDNPNLMLVRQNPTSTQTKVVSNLVQYDDGNGNMVYGRLDEQGNYIGNYTPGGSNVTYALDPKTGRYSATEYTYSFANEPGEFKGRAPSPTNAQLRKAGEIGLAEAERGSALDTGIIRSAGLKSGLKPVTRPSNLDTGLPATPPPVDSNIQTNSLPQWEIPTW